MAFFLFSLLPMAASLVLAFTNYDLLGADINFVGLDNFDRMFYHDLRYWKSVRATLKYVFFAVPLRLTFALAVAMLLNTKRRGVYLYRAAYYTPSIVGRQRGRGGDVASDFRHGWAGQHHLSGWISTGSAIRVTRCGR